MSCRSEVSAMKKILDAATSRIHYVVWIIYTLNELYKEAAI